MDEKEKRLLKIEEQQRVLKAEEERLKAGGDVEPEKVPAVSRWKPGSFDGKRLTKMTPKEGRAILDQLWEDD